MIYQIDNDRTKTTASIISASSTNQTRYSEEISLDGERPIIFSFDDYCVPVSDSVYYFLCSQYKGQEIDSCSHLNKILFRLKEPPELIYCRINLIHSSFENREEIIRKLNTKYECRREEEMGLVFKARMHDILEDCIVIERCNEVLRKEEYDIISKLRHPSGTRVTERYHWRFKDVEKRKPWPITHRVVICNRYCGESVLRGSEIYIPGILCADKGIKPGEEIAVYVDVTSKSRNITMTRGLIPEKYFGCCLFLGIGISVLWRADIFKLKKGLAVEMKNTVSSLPSLKGILPSLLQFQNLPSILVGHVLDPKPKQVILDMCAAPGGKTSHIASLVNNDAFILACDKSKKKMINCYKLFHEILGATCIFPLVLDSTKIVLQDTNEWRSPQELIEDAFSKNKDNEKKFPLQSIKSFYPNSFDRILLDPPCSALGLRPKLLLDLSSEEELRLKYPNFQKLFIQQAVLLLKVGGILTYSTCTINAMENESMVQYILDTYSCMTLLPIHLNIGNIGLPGVGLDDEKRNMVRRFCLNENTRDTIGFFVAKFQKKF